jgi:hypothetical protein
MTKGGSLFGVVCPGSLPALESNEDDREAIPKVTGSAGLGVFRASHSLGIFELRREAALSTI